MAEKKNLIYRGKAHKYGNNIDTDVIIPARYLNTKDPDELAAHCMEDIDKDFSARMKKGDIIIAGENFGCGSSREHAPLSLKASGVSCVVASSFARIFFRNAINIGLPILESPDAPANTSAGDTLEVDLIKGTIHNISSGKTFKAEPFPEFMQKIINAGGLINKTKSELEGNA
jgi:3-isopropylmalate/(R)-2-methylmalate dehydratase small subunit